MTPEWSEANAALEHLRLCEYAYPTTEEALITLGRVLEDWRRLRAQEPEPQGETAWLIESKFLRAGGPVWWMGTSHPAPWTPDSLKAVRFCRSQDAEAARLTIDDGHMSVVTEHIWIPRPQPEAQQPAAEPKLQCPFCGTFYKDPRPTEPIQCRKCGKSQRPCPGDLAEPKAGHAFVELWEGSLLCRIDRCVLLKSEHPEGR